jgi:hypothetical protein
MARLALFVLVVLLSVGHPLREAAAQNSFSFRIAAVKYSGGGDWYEAQRPLPNFLAFVRENTLLDVDPEAEVVELTSAKLFNFPFLVLSGHGNVHFTDDDYGLDKYIRREMKKVFPEQEFAELPFSHPIYHTHYDFPGGLPKIHEHDKKPPQGFGLFSNDGRLCVFYTFETNLSDGWEAPGVHPSDSPKTRLDALQMGVNVLVYAMMSPNPPAP